MRQREGLSQSDLLEEVALRPEPQDENEHREMMGGETTSLDSWTPGGHGEGVALHLQDDGAHLRAPWEVLR